MNDLTSLAAASKRYEKTTWSLNAGHMRNVPKPRTFNNYSPRNVNNAHAPVFSYEIVRFSESPTLIYTCSLSRLYFLSARFSAENHTRFPLLSSLSSPPTHSRRTQVRLVCTNIFTKFRFPVQRNIILLSTSDRKTISSVYRRKQTLYLRVIAPPNRL